MFFKANLMKKATSGALAVALLGGVALIPAVSTTAAAHDKYNNHRHYHEASHESRIDARAFVLLGGTKYDRSDAYDEGYRDGYRKGDRARRMNAEDAYDQAFIRGYDDGYNVFDSKHEKRESRGYAQGYYDALQDDGKLNLPTPQASVYQTAPNPRMNLYWGELHLHTAESFDASLFGTILGVEDAYRFARGEPLKSPGGEVMQLSRPLDFVAITDHAEGFGTRTHCGNPDLSAAERAACWLAPKIRSPAASKRSTIPWESGSSGPTTVRSISVSLAKSSSLSISSAPMGTQSASRIMPAFPGAQ